MLPKSKKLSRGLFPARNDSKFSWMGKVLRVHAYTAGDKDTGPRFAIVVPARLSTGAVSRNRFKRLVMSAIEEIMSKVGPLPHKKYVIFPKENLRTLAPNDVLEDIRVFARKKEARP